MLAKGARQVKRGVSAIFLPPAFRASRDQTRRSGDRPAADSHAAVSHAAGSPASFCAGDSHRTDRQVRLCVNFHASTAP